EAESLRRIQMVEIGMQRDAPPPKPIPQFLSNGREDVHSLVGKGQYVRVWLLVFAPNPVLCNAEHVALIRRQPCRRMLVESVGRHAVEPPDWSFAVRTAPVAFFKRSAFNSISVSPRCI